MNINELSLTNIKNILNTSIIFNNKINVFIGNNANGKSNFIDSIYFLSNLKSYRNNDDLYMINFDEKEAKIYAKITNNGIINNVNIYFHKERNKKVIINDKIVYKMSDYIGKFNITLFSPDDLLIVKGDSSYRRRFMDNLFSQIDLEYLKYLIDYFKVLKQRNQLLKMVKNNFQNDSSLDPWDEQLVSLSSIIYKKRSEKVKYLTEICNKIHKLLNNEEDLSVVYKDTICSGIDELEADYEIVFKNKLKRARVEEINRGTSLLGSHRDDLEIKINNINTKIFGSQGQKRSVAISMRMGEAEILKNELKEYPVLLLDDIFSELDENRKTDLLSIIDNRSQVFITGTQIHDFGRLTNNADVFQILNGEISLKHEC